MRYAIHGLVLAATLVQWLLPGSLAADDAAAKSFSKDGKK